MGWKTINGRRYYYKSERDGGRVKSTYFGGGESGQLISLLELEDRAEREAECEQRQAEREEFESEEKAVAEWFDGVQAVADAAMIATGFHKHKGQWRRKRR
jgi:hypothetical protein